MANQGLAVVTYQSILLNQATGQALKIPTDWSDLHYVKNDCKVGRFDLVLPGSFAVGLETKFKDWRLIVWRTVKARQESRIDFAGFVRQSQRIYDGGNRRVLLSGPCYNQMLDRRIIAYPAGNAMAYKTQVYADDMMKEFVDENLGGSATDSDRDYSNYMSIQANQGAGTQLRKACSWENLLGVLWALHVASRKTPNTAAFFGVVPLGTGYDMEFRTRIGQWGQDHQHPAGVDGAVVFSVDSGNVTYMHQDYDSDDELTVVYGVGPGHRDDRMQVEVSNATGITESVINRIEAAYENSNSETSNNLTDQSEERLREYLPKEDFAVTVASIPGCEIGVHWDLGDQVTVIDLNDQPRDMRVIQRSTRITGDAVTHGAKVDLWP